MELALAVVLLALGLAALAILLRSSSSEPRLPADAHQIRPPRLVMISAILWYTFLAGRGLVFDFIDRIHALLFPGKAAVPLADPSRHGAPLKSGLQDLYERHLFGWLADTFNRPITGEAGGIVLVKERAFNKATREHEMTGRDLRCVNLGSYNYLGFGGCDEFCTPAVLRAVEEHGACTGSARAEFGTSAVHVELEETVARMLGKDAAVTTGMGFATNSTMIPILVDADGDGSGVLLLSDALNHSSIIEGVRSSGASVWPVVHNSMIDLEAKLRLARTRGQPGSGRPWRKIIVLVEGIYSMEGEFCLLRQVVALKRAYGAYLYLDEAHSIGAVGATGRGVAELLGVPTSEIDVMMGTFTKSFGSVGGYVAGSHAVIAALRAHSHSVLHANAMSVPAVQQVLSSLRVISQADGPGSAAAAVGRAKLQQLAENTAFFRQGLLEMGCEVLGDDGSPVVPIMIYHPRRMCLFSRELLKRRVAVVVVGYPASPILLERARFCVSAAHTRADLEGALRSIREVAAQQGLFYHADPALRKATAARCAEKAARLHGAPLVLPNEAEIQAALGPWTPEPLCGGAPANLAAAAAPAPARAAAVAASTTSLALALYDPLGFCAEATLRATAAATIRAYGVGTCGPRAFYGTLDLHMQLEDDLARFLGTERSIVYSSAVATISSVLPAFAKRVDTVFVDDGALASARLRQGVELSRARVRVYPLGEMGALKALLDEADAHDARLPVAKRGRRIIVTEGVCAASGDVAPLPALLELRDAYGAYLFVDETHSIGVLGAGGRGVAEHYGIAPGRIDAIIGSLEGALGSVGGFCAGSLQVVRQQRLFATGFIFSASLPAYCTAVAQRALALLIAEPERAAAARAASRALRVGLDASGVARSRSLVVSGGECGLLHVRAPAVSGGPAAQRAALERVAARVLARAALGLVVLPTEEAAAEPTAQARARAAPLPSLRLTPCGRLTAAQLGAAVEAIAAALAAELPAASPGSPLALKPPMLRANGGSAGNAAGLDLMLPPAALGSLRPARSDDGDSTGSSSDDQPGGAADDEPLAPTRVAAGGAAACGGKAAGGKAGADDSELVTAETPLGLLLALGRRQLHVYLRRQAEWGVRTIVQPAQAACASSRVACHVFYVMSLFGSEAFYMASFPLLIWTEAASGVDGAASLARTLVLFFAASVVVGNVLKVWLALPRPQLNAAAGGARIPPADEGWNRDFAWPSISAMNAIGLPFFVLRYRFGGTYLWEQSEPLTTVLFYAAAFLWAAGICGSRIVAGAASPADVQGGMLIGSMLVRLGLPWHEALTAWLSDPHATVLGAQPELLLPVLASALMLLHPVTPTDGRGAYSATNSAKALAFATAFALGSRARILETASAPPASRAYGYHGFCGLLLMAAILALTHAARRAAVRLAARQLGLGGKVVACGLEYYLLGLLVALWVPRSLDFGASVGHTAATLVYF